MGRDKGLRISWDSEVTEQGNTIYIDGDFAFTIQDDKRRDERVKILKWFVECCKIGKENNKPYFVIGPYPKYKREFKSYFNQHNLFWTFKLDYNWFCIDTYHQDWAKVITDRVRDMVIAMGGEVDE